VDPDNKGDYLSEPEHVTYINPFPKKNLDGSVMCSDGQINNKFRAVLAFHIKKKSHMLLRKKQQTNGIQFTQVDSKQLKPDVKPDLKHMSDKM
jgi:hypothetical protein